MLVLSDFFFSGLGSGRQELQQKQGGCPANSFSLAIRSMQGWCVVGAGEVVRSFARATGGRKEMGICTCSSWRGRRCRGQCCAASCQGRKVQNKKADSFSLLEPRFLSSFSPIPHTDCNVHREGGREGGGSTTLFFSSSSFVLSLSF